MNLNLKPPMPKREVDADKLEELFAEGLEQKEVAARLGFVPTVLSRKINNSARLTDARERGRRRAKR